MNLDGRRHFRAMWSAGLVGLLVLTGLPAPAEAQFGRTPRRTAPTERVRAIEVGARGGIDIRFEDPVLGGHFRIPIDPWNRIELMPGALVTFVSGGTDYQLDADAVVLVDPAGVLFAGGGASFRNVGTDEDPEAGFETGYNLIVGLKTPRQPDERGPQAQIEFRFSEVIGIEHPILTLGFNYPLVIF